VKTFAEALRIDCHMHLYPNREEGAREKETYEIWEYGRKDDVEFSGFGGDVADAEQAMRQDGFSHAIITNLFAVALLPKELQKASPEAHRERLLAANRWACSVAADRPQFTTFVAADPTVLGGEEGAAHLREMAERHGAKGIKIHPVVQRFMPDDQAMYPIYRTCVELGLAVLSHSGSARDGRPWAEPESFANVVRAFPKLTLILAHLGGGAWKQTSAFASTFKGVFFDLCEIIAWTGAPKAPSKDELARMVLDIGPERVMLGTDFPWYDLGRTAEQVMELPLLSEEQKIGILGANAARILHIAG
jgi:predicted TIM-barrel fold metal-dependent hydrolase